jgi:hypothetical protein
VARLQPWALYQDEGKTDLRLSEIVAVSPTQLIPSRTLEMRRNGETVDLSVEAGASYFQRPGAGEAVNIDAMFEERLGEADDPLAWRALGDPVPMQPTGEWNERVWRASITIPSNSRPIRVRVDEYEMYVPEQEAESLRLVYTDALRVT